LTGIYSSSAKTETLYVNGISQEATNIINGMALYSGQVFTIAGILCCRESNGNRKGAIEQVSIYNIAFSAPTIAALYRPPMLNFEQ
jgi:hypothetical protein